MSQLPILKVKVLLNRVPSHRYYCAVGRHVSAVYGEKNSPRRPLDKNGDEAAEKAGEDAESVVVVAADQNPRMYKNN
jgi:hypothetical protein